jgi:hypothetical protein
MEGNERRRARRVFSRSRLALSMEAWTNFKLVDHDFDFTINVHMHNALSISVNLRTSVGAQMVHLSHTLE